MKLQQREQLLEEVSNLENFTKVKKRVKFYTLQLEKFIDTKKLEDLNLTPPMHFHEYIQELRSFEKKKIIEECNFLLLKLISIANKLANLIISLPKKYAELIWIVRDILGRDHLFFDKLNLTNQQINIIQISLRSKQPEYWPFIILTRYINTRYHVNMYPLISGYIDNKNNTRKSMFDVAETLVFLNGEPQELLKMFAKSLNDPNCNKETAAKLLDIMNNYNEYDYLVIDELVDFIENIQNYNDSETILMNLTNFIQSRDVASILLPYISIILKKNNQTLSKDLFEPNNRSKQILLTFYGHLQAIVNRDI